ncbi:MAG: hypothetical protein QM758_29775 [Armatimonas sp.]
MFLLVVPTIRQTRPGFSEAMERLRASLTLPTDLHILDGSAGKAQTLNMAYDTLLQPSGASIYVTLDDDIIPPHGWQDQITSAFDSAPSWGALGLWLGEPHRAYMGLSGVPLPVARQPFSYIPTHNNLVGCLIAFRHEVALGVGKIPDSPQKYQYWEDGWRCQRVRAQGYDLAYLYDPENIPELITYADPTEYLAAKDADIAASQGIARHMLGQNRLKSLWKRFRKR